MWKKSFHNATTFASTLSFVKCLRNITNDRNAPTVTYYLCFSWQRNTAYCGLFLIFCCFVYESGVVFVCFRIRFNWRPYNESFNHLNCKMCITQLNIIHFYRFFFISSIISFSLNRTQISEVQICSNFCIVAEFLYGDKVHGAWWVLRICKEIMQKAWVFWLLV